MWNGAKRGGGVGECGEPILLQRLLDGDLPDAAALVVTNHLEVCEACRTALNDLQGLKSFVDGRLGCEDEGEEEASAHVLRGVFARVRGEIERQAPSSDRSWWRATLLGVAAALTFIAVLWIPFDQRVDASAARILAENRIREQAWLYQPEKVLHWEAVTEAHGIHGIPDGRTRIEFWRRNGPITFEEITRAYDASGRTIWATWRMPDGGSVAYLPHTADRIEITTSIPELRAALPTLSNDSRDALKALVERRERNRTLEFGRGALRDWIGASTAFAIDGPATLRRDRSADWGELYRITTNDSRQPPQSEIAGATQEHDIESRGFRTVHLKSTVRYRDGTVGTHETRWTGFAETTSAAFDAHVPRDLLAGGIPVVRLTPLEVARRALQSLKPNAGTH